MTIQKNRRKKKEGKKELCRTRTQHPWLGAKLEFAYPRCCGVEEQMLIFSSSLTPERVSEALELKSDQGCCLRKILGSPSGS